jgi:Arc/MetJ-type ribon-helix-helix transcriptional regulator
MAKAIHVRLDPQSELALALIRSHGRTDSEAVREALCAMAERMRSRAAIRAEARALGEDPVDLAEAAAVLSMMQELSPHGGA